MSRKVTVRIAENADGPAIKTLLAAQGGMAEGVDFSAVKPYWIVAEIDGGVVGCMQTVVSRPIGHLENLGVRQDLSSLQRGEVLRQLVLDGAAILYNHGVTHIRFFTGFEQKGLKRALKKRGAAVVEPGLLMQLRIA